MLLQNYMELKPIVDLLEFVPFEPKNTNVKLYCGIVQ